MVRKIKHKISEKPILYQQEKDLQTYGLDIVRDYFRTITTTSNYIYGKDVRILYKDREPNIYLEDISELETWAITLPVYAETDIPTLLDSFQYLAQQKELEKIAEVGDDVHNLTLHNLCDWVFLSNEEGHIILHNTVTLVRYAKVLRNKEIK